MPVRLKARVFLLRESKPMLAEANQSPLLYVLIETRFRGAPWRMIPVKCVVTIHFKVLTY